MLSRIINIILYYDKVCWYFLNNQWHNDFLDFLIPFFRNQWFWTPVYLFLLLFITGKFGKKGWYWCAFFLFTFFLSDQISASILKPLFHRIRPCNDTDYINIVHLLVPCGGGYSFPSSHASNHFAIGMFMAVTLSKYIKWIWFIPLLWAAVVSYSQVYVGVHYPLDVFCGAILGITLGAIFGSVFNRKHGFELRYAGKEKTGYFL